MISHEEKQRMSDLEHGIEFREERIKRLQETVKLTDNKGWKALEKDIDLSIESVKNRLSAIAMGNRVIWASTGESKVLTGSELEAEVHTLGGQLLAYSGTKFNVNEAQKQMDRLNDEIGRFRQEWKSLREKQQSGKPSKSLSGVV